MDAFGAMSTLIHRLVRPLQDAIRGALGTEVNAWQHQIVDKLSAADKAYWRKDGIVGVEKLDLQAILKAIDNNRSFFERLFGSMRNKCDLYSMRHLRNAYAHDCGFVPSEIALDHIEYIRGFATWMRLPEQCMGAIDDVKKRLGLPDASRSIVIKVSPVRDETITIAMTEACSVAIQKFGDDIKKIAEIRIAEFYKGKVNELTDVGHNVFTLCVTESICICLFRTPNDEYICVDAIRSDGVRDWIKTHSVVFDADTIHVLITEKVQGMVERKVWTNSDDIEVRDAAGVDGADDETRRIKRIETSGNGFVLVDEDLCRRMLEGKLGNWQIYLHPDQLRAVQMDADGPMMVKGPAGTGKTVVIVHRAKWLLENVFRNGERILITTFNKSLERNILMMLRAICSEEELQRLEVKHFDDVLQDLWREIGGKRILYKDREVYSDSNVLWRRLTALKNAGVLPSNRSPEFLDREYDAIIQEHGICSEEDYLKVTRPHSFDVLRKEDRALIWNLLDVVISSPTDEKANPSPVSTKMRVINHVENSIRSGRLNIQDRYAAVLVDESQDMGAAEYRLFAAMTECRANSLMFCGDGHQRIYSRMGSLKKCGINVMGGRTVQLRRCYRCSKEIKDFAERVLTGLVVTDIDDNADSLEGSSSECAGDKPEIRFFGGGNYKTLYDGVIDRLKQWQNAGDHNWSSYAVLLREGSYMHKKTWKLDKFCEAIKQAGIPAVVIHGREAVDETNSLKVMTMHRAKGMQFYGVVLDLDGWPHRDKGLSSPEAEKEEEDRERLLLYMSVTRAVRHVLITGTQSKLKRLPQQ